MVYHFHENPLMINSNKTADIFGIDIVDHSICYF